MPTAASLVLGLALLAWALLLWAAILHAARGGEDPNASDAFFEAFKPQAKRGTGKRTIDQPPESPHAPVNGSSRLLRFVAPSSVTPGGVVKPAKSPGEAKSK